MTNEELRHLVFVTGESHTREHLALGYLRYEAVRKLTPGKYAELCERNLVGERFDELVDGLIEPEG